jgi:RecJ-like exonuclease
LNPNKLFAIVDLDNQDKTIEDYSFPSTDAIFFDLYQKFHVNPQNVSNHRIWTTGLIHKEAYFIIPELQDFFDTYINIPYYKDKPLSLNTIYLDMAESIIDDIDIERNFQGVKKRLKDNFDSEFNNKNDLKDLWIDKFNVTVEKEQKDQLILALLTIKKAKNFWENIHPPEDVSILPERFQEQLSLEIARQFYVNQTNNPQYHIPYFLETIQKISENRGTF